MINSLKAAFLLAVFSLHTVVSLACSLGIDIGTRCNDHYDLGTAETSRYKNEACKRQSYQDGETIHHRGQKKTRSSAHLYAGIKKHNHQNKAMSYQQKSMVELRDNCCNDDIMNVNQPDKEFTQFILFNTVFFTSFLSTFLSSDILPSSQTTPSVKYFVRSYHPPIPDIRIVIQSFQI